MPDDSQFYVAIAVAFFGFMALAFLLLYPIYRFMRKEEQRSEAWTRSALAERQRRALEQAERSPERATAGDGAGDGAGGAGGDGTAGSAGGEGGPGEPPEIRP